LNESGGWTIRNIVFTFMVVLVKILSTTVPVIQILFMRYSTMLLLGVIIGVLDVSGLRKQLVNAAGMGKLFVRGMAYTIFLFTIFRAYSLMPIVIVTGIYSTYPVFTAIFGALFLGEYPTRFEIACLCLIAFALPLFFVPHILLTPFGSDSHAVGIVLSLVAGVACGAQMVTVRSTRGSSHWLQLETTTSIICIVIGCPIAAAIEAGISGGKTENIWVSCTHAEWGLIMLVCTLGFFGLAIVTHGQQLAPSTPAAIAMSSELPLIFLAQATYLDDHPLLYEWVGLCMMSFALVAMTFGRADKRGIQRALSYAAMSIRGSLNQSSFFVSVQMPANAEADPGGSASSVGLTCIHKTAEVRSV